MRFVFFKMTVFFAALFALQSHARGTVAVESLAGKDFSKLSFNRLQSLRKAYVDFAKHAENKLYAPQSYQGRPDFYSEYNKSGEAFFFSFYAFADETGQLCFFGGWPSRMSGPYCQAPWKHRNDSEVQAYGQVYGPKRHCGEKDLFRCNPALFGEGENTCVKMEGTYKELTDKCEAATADNVAGLVSQIKNDPDKAEQLAKFNQAIFGEEGFCTTFQAKYNKEYDACDSLKKRISDLMGSKSSQSPAAAAAPGPGKKDSRALALLKQCEQGLPEDVNGRNIMQTLQAGVAACSKEGHSAPELGEIEELGEEFDKYGFLRSLNLKNFEYKVRSLLNLETGFDGQGRSLAGQSDKSALRADLEERFPLLKEDGQYQELYERIYNQHQKAKDDGKAKKLDLNNMANEFRLLANGNPGADPPIKGVNQVCKDIHDNFMEKHGEGRSSWLEKAMWFDEEEEATIDGMRGQLNSAIDQAARKSRLGFLLGTDHFQEHVLDPTVDLAEECAQDPGYVAMNPTLSARDIQTAAKQARQEILKSFEDLKDAERAFTQTRWRGKAKENTVEAAIKDHLRENKIIVADVLALKEGDTQARAARYLCDKTKDIYAADKRLQIVSFVGAGVSLVGGAACVFPLTAPVGCPVMAAGTAVSTAASGARTYEGYQLGQSSSLNQIQREQRASRFIAERDSADNQFVAGATEVALSKGGLAITGVAKMYRATRAAKAVAVKNGDSLRSLARVPKAASGRQTKALEGKAQKLLEGPPKTSLQKAGTTRVKFTDPDTGREYVRYIDSRVMAMGDLDDTTRIKAIKEIFGPYLSSLDDIRADQIKAIMQAHRKFPCAIGKCSAKMIKEKLRYMIRKGVPEDVAADSIRLGITGFSEKALAAFKTAK